MAKKKPGPKPKTPRNDTTAKIDAEVMHKVRIVAAMRKQSIAEYLTETMRKVVEVELEKFKGK